MNHRLLFTSIITLLNFCFVPTLCYAQDFDNGLYISIPSEWNEKPMDNKDIIYHGNSETDKLELAISTKRNIQTNRINNWKDIPEAEIKKQANKSLEKQKKDNDTQLKKWELLETPQMRFLIFDGTITNNKKTTFFTQYITIINGGTLQFSFYSKSPLTNHQKEVAESIVSTAHYDKITQASIDTKIILEVIGIFLVIILLIASVIWNIKRYRKKIKMEVKENGQKNNKN